ncbi:MAG: hypothetical protein Q8K98_06045 [Bacteroidota bacterium]|nr:hypothetical protein [Bacteroidota bacterium]
MERWKKERGGKKKQWSTALSTYGLVENIGVLEEWIDEMSR